MSSYLLVQDVIIQNNIVEVFNCKSMYDILASTACAFPYHNELRIYYYKQLPNQLYLSYYLLFGSYYKLNC